MKHMPIASLRTHAVYPHKNFTPTDLLHQIKCSAEKFVSCRVLAATMATRSSWLTNYPCTCFTYGLPA